MRGVAFCFQELWQQLKVLRDSLQHLNKEESTLAEEPQRERARTHAHVQARMRMRAAHSKLRWVVNGCWVLTHCKSG